MAQEKNLEPQLAQTVIWKDFSFLLKELGLWFLSSPADYKIPQSEQ